MSEATHSLPAHERRILVEHASRTGGSVEDLTRWRLQGIPLQHLTGEAWFRHECVAVGPGVFIPRPETEVMTGWVIEALTAVDAGRVVELCAGSGAISMAIVREAPGHQQWAVEKSPEAFAFLERNLAHTDVACVLADFEGALPELDGLADVVVANPPYVPLEAWEGLPADVRDHDPGMALFSGVDGLDAMRALIPTAARLLRAGGVFAAEHAEVQHEAVVDLMVSSGLFDRVRDHRDLTDRWRFVTGVRLP